MCRFIVLMMLAIFAFTGGILALTTFPDTYLPLIQPVVCGPNQTLENNLTNIRLSGGMPELGFNCLDREGQRASVTLPVVAITFAPALILIAVMVISGLASLGDRRRILTQGENGVGRVQSVRYTGVQVNNQPVYAITLEVFTLERAPYTTTTRKRSGYYGITGSQYAPGMLVAVKIDPRNPNKVLIPDDQELDPLLVQKAGGRTATTVQGAGVDVADVLRQFTGGMGAGSVTVVSTSTGETRPGDMEDVTDVLRQFTGQSGGYKAVSGGESSLTERLEELKKAYDSGLITADEYETQRKRLLDAL